MRSVRSMKDPDGELLIPPGALVVLIGAAGSGKSTFAASRFPGESILSSDALRARLGAGENDQTVTRASFALLHRLLDGRLASGRPTVVDATNVTIRARASLLKIAHRHGAPAVAVILELPVDLVVSRNAARAERVVPEGAVRRQIAELGRAGDDQLRHEGFAIVRRLRSAADVAAIRVLISDRR